MIGGKRLPAGKYTLWTIPGSKEWLVMFNDKMYSWGVGFDQKPSREAEHDVLETTVPVQKLSKPVEQFTISFAPERGGAVMNLVWDRTKISIPVLPAE